MDFAKLCQIVLCLLVAVICAGKAQPMGYQEDQLEAASEARDKRDHHHGVTGPVHTFVKTDKHANFKWGVRHHVGHHYAGRR